ncbi:EAL domain-containing response regulator [Halomonas campisalis]|uniref:EAL domain-containing response regulator n=1 Tax=Billgrantia campisalis TaxID=74661 RepID=A0ABS9PB71_9GAMM|nr:EAL domain-containing response regulator [Halomonas campisalis]MCG6659020.1 EAL domain-containing response regulator [Halomonas campisalis]MDR5863741.1 EAL domain-containing response regulator [Halomonas campisalis]
MPISTDSEQTTGLPPGLRLLIVEDHDFQRQVLAGLLRRLGAEEIHEAACGHSALELMATLEPPVDIVISDLDMPGMDGMEFIRRVGESWHEPALVIVSALEPSLIRSVRTMAAAYGLSLLDTIEKPPAPRELLSALRKYKPDQRRLRAPPMEEHYSAADLEAAMVGDQFEPFFQPKVELATGRLCGFEALARWRHPEHGVLSPHAFIDTMESRGLIDALTDVMLDKASAWCAFWRNRGLDIKVSVNISIQSLADVGLAESLIERVRRQGLDPCYMILEITETAVMIEVGRVLENLARLRMKGFELSIDDYGTGYSSMQQLTRIAAGELKIDRTFVNFASHQNDGRVILRSSLEMARKLNLTTVAEGVETPEDWALLAEYGCDQAQGYLIARPMAADTVADWAQQWDPERWLTGLSPELKQ